MAAVATTAGHDFFLTAPYHSFSISATEDVIATVVLLASASPSASSSCGPATASRGATRRRCGRSMRRVAGVDAGADRGWLIMAACQELLDTLDADEIEYLPGAVPPIDGGHGHAAVTVPCRTTTDRDRWTMALPVESLGRPVGYFDVVVRAVEGALPASASTPGPRRRARRCPRGGADPARFVPQRQLTFIFGCAAASVALRARRSRRRTTTHRSVGSGDAETFGQVLPGSAVSGMSTPSWSATDSARSRSFSPSLRT